MPPGIPGTAMKIKKKQKPKTPMKPLFWSTINARDIKNTCWESMDDEKIISQINLGKLEEEFSTKNQKPKGKGGASMMHIPKENTILEGPRLQNMSMVFAKIKKKPIEIVNALLSYDLNILTENLCDIILPILPKDEEINNIRSIEDISSYSECDKFVHLISEVTGFQQRVKSIQFKYQFSNNYKIISEKIDKLKMTMDTFKNDKRINDWLTILLAFGNYLNGQSARGGAYGFKLDSLSKITEMKSNDNKKTLLQFIIEWIYENNDPDLLNVDLNYAKDISFKNTQEFFNEIKASFNVVKKLKNITENIENENDKSKEFLQSFYDDIVSKLNEKENELNSVNDDFEKLVLSFGEKIKDMPFEKFFQIFISFFENVKNMKEKVDRLRKLQEKKK